MKKRYSDEQLNLMRYFEQTEGLDSTQDDDSRHQYIVQSISKNLNDLRHLQLSHKQLQQTCAQLEEELSKVSF